MASPLPCWPERAIERPPLGPFLCHNFESRQPAELKEGPTRNFRTLFLAWNFTFWMVPLNPEGPLKPKLSSPDLKWSLIPGVALPDVEWALSGLGLVPFGRNGLLRPELGPIRHSNGPQAWDGPS